MRTTYILEGSLTAVQPLATCSKDLKDMYERVKGSGLPTPVPSTVTAEGVRLMFPATGIRGKLRRCLRDALRQAVIERTGNPKPFSLDQHYLLTLGGIKADGAESKSTVALEAQWRDKNPLLSLFGAGAAGVLGFMQGRLSVGNAVCRVASQPVTFSGARSDDLYRDRSQVAFLSDEDVQALVNRSEGNRDRSAIDAQLKAKLRALKAAQKKGDEDAAEALQGEVNALEETKRQVLDASGSGSVSVGMPLVGFQAIPMGEVMDHRMVVAHATAIELGALLAALEQLSAFPILGAHFATGCGQVQGQWEVFKVVPGQGRVSLGVVGFEPFTGVLDVQAPADGELQAARAAFAQFACSDAFVPSIPSA